MLSTVSFTNQTHLVAVMSTDEAFRSPVDAEGNVIRPSGDTCGIRNRRDFYPVTWTGDYLKARKLILTLAEFSCLATKQVDRQAKLDLLTETILSLKDVRTRPTELNQPPTSTLFDNKTLCAKIKEHLHAARINCNYSYIGPNSWNKLIDADDMLSKKMGGM